MFQSTTHTTEKTRRIQVAAICCLLAMLTSILFSTVAYAGESRALVARLDPEGSTTLRVEARNCTLYIEPAEDDRPECHFNSGTIRFEQSNEGGIQTMTVSGISGKKMDTDAVATVYIPRSGFDYLYVEADSADVMLTRGIQYNHDIALRGSRLGMQYTSGTDNAYYLRLLDRSWCDFVIPENATGYGIQTTVVKGQLSVPVDGMPEYTGGGSYTYTAGTASSKIIVDVKDSSNMRFFFARGIE